MERGRDLEGAKITLNEYLDRWLETAVRARVRPKTFQDYQGMLHRYVRPILGDRVLAGMSPLDLQTMYQQMTERGLSARTVRYAHAVVKSAMQQAVRWTALRTIGAVRRYPFVLHWFCALPIIELRCTAV